MRCGAAAPGLSVGSGGAALTVMSGASAWCVCANEELSFPFFTIEELNFPFFDLLEI
jgi:hypothetical protein